MYTPLSRASAGALSLVLVLPLSSLVRAGDAAPEIIVDWSGDYVDRDTDLDRPWVDLYPIALDDTEDDARSYYALSDDEPIQPPPNQYRAGSSHVFYGGASFERRGEPLSFSRWIEIWDVDADDQIYVAAQDSGTDGWALFYWKREDFLRRSAGAPLRFGPASRLELNDYQGGRGRRENNSGLFRFVIRDGERFWISRATADRTTVSFALDDPESQEWAPYDPAPPIDIVFDTAGATFRRRQFEDVTAVGFYHSNDNASDLAERKAGFTVRQFRVVLDPTDGGPVDPEDGRHRIGDCNHDGAIDISDPICSLLALFVDASLAPTCEGDVGDDAKLLDTNSDGVFDLSDPIAALRGLFLGEPFRSSCETVVACPGTCT